MSEETEGEFASAPAVAALASELERFKYDAQERFDTLDRVPSQLESLADRIEALATELKALAERGKDKTVLSWMTAPAEPQKIYEILVDLVRWMDAVWMRYPDGKRALRECWLWHPNVVEELLWCKATWTTAFQGRTASPQAVGDWHDRYRPGVARRIKETLDQCNLGQHAQPEPPATAPTASAVNLITAWWSEHRHEPAPAPAPEHYPANTRVAN